MGFVVLAIYRQNWCARYAKSNKTHKMVTLFFTNCFEFWACRLRRRCVSGFASLRASHPPTLRQAQGPRRPYTHLTQKYIRNGKTINSPFWVGNFSFRRAYFLRMNKETTSCGRFDEVNRHERSATARLNMSASDKISSKSNYLSYHQYLPKCRI